MHKGMKATPKDNMVGYIGVIQRDGTMKPQRVMKSTIGKFRKSKDRPVAESPYLQVLLKEGGYVVDYKPAPEPLSYKEHLEMRILQAKKDLAQQMFSLGGELQRKATLLTGYFNEPDSTGRTNELGEVQLQGQGIDVQCGKLGALVDVYCEFISRSKEEEEE